MSIEESKSESYQIVDEDKNLSDLEFEPSGMADDDSMLNEGLTERMGELANFDSGSTIQEKDQQQTTRLDSKYLIEPIEEEESFDLDFSLRKCTIKNQEQEESDMFSQFMQGNLKEERSESIWTKEENKELEQSEYELVRNQTLMEKSKKFELMDSNYSKQSTEMFNVEDDETFSRQGTEMRPVSQSDGAELYKESGTSTEVERVQEQSLENLFEQNLKKVNSKQADTFDDISYAESIIPESEYEEEKIGHIE